MPIIVKPLTKKEINNLPDGRFAVGGTPGLYVDKSKGKIVCWILRDRNKGRHQYYPGYLSLDIIRVRAAQDKASLFLGIDPSGEKKRLKKQKAEERRKLKEDKVFPNLKQIFSEWLLDQKKKGRWAKKTNSEQAYKKMVDTYFLNSYGEKKLSNLTEDDLWTAILKGYEVGAARGRVFLPFFKSCSPTVFSALN